MKKKFYILLVIFFIQGIATNMHHPLMPAYVKHLELPSFMIGLFFALMNFGTMMGGPFWGNLGDRGKKKKVVILGFTIYGLGQLLFGLGYVFNQYFLGVFRFASGFGIAAATTIIMSEIILVSPENKKSRNIAYGVAILALGGSLGYFLGGQLFTNQIFFTIFKTDFANTLFLQALLNISLAIGFYFVYKPVKFEIIQSSKRTFFWEGFKEIRNIPKSLLFFLISLSIITIAATNVDKYLEIYFDDLGFAPDVIGNFKMIVGIVSIAVTLIIVPFVMKLKKRLTVISILQILSAVIVFIVFRSSATYFMIMIYTVYMLYIVIKAIFSPLEQDYVASFSDPSKISTTMGIRQSFYSIGTIIGPILGGVLYGVSPSVLFNFSASMFLISILFLYITHRLYLKETVKA